MFALLLFCFTNYVGIVSNNLGKLHHIFLLKNIYQIILNHLSAAHNMDWYKPFLFLQNQILSFSSIFWCHDNSLFYWHSPYDHSVSIDTWFHIFYMIYFVPKLFILEISFQLRTKNASSYWRTITIHCALCFLHYLSGCAEFFGMRNGQEYIVSHYLFKKRCPAGK